MFVSSLHSLHGVQAGFKIRLLTYCLVLNIFMVVTKLFFCSYKVLGQSSTIFALFKYGNRFSFSKHAKQLIDFCQLKIFLIHSKYTYCHLTYSHAYNVTMCRSVFKKAVTAKYLYTEQTLWRDLIFSS